MSIRMFPIGRLVSMKREDILLYCVLQIWYICCAVLADATGRWD